MIKAIFLSRFHPEKGPIVAHQIPEGAVLPSPQATLPRPLFDFDSVSSYLIPSQEFCNRLVTVTASHYRIIGYPVCIVDPARYNRNEYIFNVSIVLDEKEDFTSFEGVVRKLARVFRELEGIGRLLSRDEKEEGAGKGGHGGQESGTGGGKGSTMKKAPHVGGKVYAICEMILEDLNNYCECMTPIDSANTLNMKLFPIHPAPPRPRPHQVPLATSRLLTLNISSSHLSSTSGSTPFDLTTTRLLPHINGINSISDIAHLANADVSLVRRSIAHLLYYGGLLMLDVFTTGAVYAQTADIGVIFADVGMQAECARYIATGIGQGHGRVLANDDVLRLFASTRHGLTVRAWCEENAAPLDGVDVRRFMTFGVVKGLLYRVHKYAVASTAAGSGDEVKIAVAGAAGNGEQRAGDETPTTAAPAVDMSMARYMDGMHSFDEICTALGISEKTVMARMREAGEVTYIYR